MYTNVDSYNNKRAKVVAIISILDPDVVGLTEVNPKRASWNLCKQDLELEGYNLYASLEGRGVAFYVKNTLEFWDPKPKTGCVDTVLCETKLREQDKLTVGLVHRSLSSTNVVNDKMMSLLTELADKKSTHFLLMGDFNFPDINWNRQISKGPTHERDFLEVYREWFLWQHVRKPTRYRTTQKANILDLVMTNEQAMEDEINYGEPLGRSDHQCIDWT